MPRRSRTVRPPSRAWRRSLPRITDPLPDEALAGLLLRAEDLSHLVAGGASLRHRKYHSAALLDAQLVTGRCIDLELFCEAMGELPLEQVLATTLRPTLSWQFAEGIARGPSLFHAAQRVCPDCARERHLLLVAAVVRMSACPRHGLAFVRSCECGQEIALFRRQRPFHCHACGKDYARLRRIPASADQIARARRADHVLRQLLALSPRLRRMGLEGVRLALAHLIWRRGGRPELIEHVFRRHALPIDLVVDTLLELNRDARSLLRADDESRRLRRAADPRISRLVARQRFWAERPDAAGRRSHTRAPRCATS